MLIAREKRKTNIAEYILYMWQVEDMLRALKFDSSLIESTLVKGFNQPPAISSEIRDWYLNLVWLMKGEGIQQAGHLQVFKNLVNELNDLHVSLMSRPEEIDYINSYQKAAEIISDLKTRQNSINNNEIEVCLIALYGILLLKLQKKEISEATEKSMQVIAGFISKLSAKFLQYEKGEIEFD